MTCLILIVCTVKFLNFNIFFLKNTLNSPLVLEGFIDGPEAKTQFGVQNW